MVLIISDRYVWFLNKIRRSCPMELYRGALQNINHKTVSTIDGEDARGTM